MHGEYETTSSLVHASDHTCPYRKTSSISRTKSESLNVSCILLQLSSPIPLKPGVKLRMKDVVGAAPRGDAPTTSELSTIRTRT